MIKTVRFSTVFAALVWCSVGVSGPARAADEYGIANEKVVQFEVKVVDIACQLTGNCPANCGGGKRQLGLVTPDGKLRLPVKGQTLFANAIPDLLPYCGKSVMVDGLLIENPVMTIVHVQNLRETADQKWTPTEAFEADWTKKNGKAEEWQRADPLVKAVIAADGVYGIRGLEPPKK
jgi:hypothetical protein